MSGLSHPEPAPVWQKRFYDFNVWTEKKQVEKLRYMHRNPVKRGFSGPSGTVEVEQLSFLPFRRARPSTGEISGVAAGDQEPPGRDGLTRGT
jgi:hypothetical protein